MATDEKDEKYQVPEITALLRVIDVKDEAMKKVHKALEERCNELTVSEQLVETYKSQVDKSGMDRYREARAEVDEQRRINYNLRIDNDDLKRQMKGWKYRISERFDELPFCMLFVCFVGLAIGLGIGVFL